MATALDYACELIEFDSVSSVSNVPVTEYVEGRLKSLGFETERIDYTDAAALTKANVIGKLGAGHGGVAFFGHTDVVPAVNWKFDDHGPFQPVVRDGRLYGRGSTDMKGPVACMLAAAESLSASRLREPVYICCTADEEVGMLGAEQIAKRSVLYREIVQAETRSIVGEPTRLEVVYAHKGGCVMRVTSHGRAAHSSTRNGINANWKMIPFLMDMKLLHEELENDPNWRNPEFDPPTMCLNLSVNDHNPAINITAASSICMVYFRAMHGLNADPVVERIQAAAKQHGLELELTFRATPFYVDPQSPFVQECLDFSAVKQPQTVSYGTDAAQFGNLRRCVIMGPGDIAQAHTHDEWISLKDLEAGTAAYRGMLERWCLG